MSAGLVTVDLDSTLCDTRHRHHMISRTGETDWDAYSLACPGDTPIAPVVALVRALAGAHRIAIVSGRSAVAMPQTAAWLHRHDVPYDSIWLDEGQGAFATHEDYKVRRVVEATMFHGTAHVLHIDDWPPVAPALEAAGFKVVIVTPPRIIDDFDPDGHGHLTFV